MAIDSIGAIAYANQAMPAQTKLQSNFQNRLDMQTGAGMALQDADQQEIQDVRPAEETYKIDPENEHEKKRNQEEQEESENASDEDLQSELDEESSEMITARHLDIKV
jgi:hypothetical protein